MHPINKFLSWFGLQLQPSGRAPRVPEDFMANYNANLASLMENNSRRFDVFSELYYEAGVHPTNYIDFECGFAAYHMNRLNPNKTLDIGSYRHFILGMLSHFQVTTVDVRNRAPISRNEVIVTCDAKKLTLPANEFDVVVSLCALEHFGLGRYGDEYDLDADKKAFEEIIRVLKPNGCLIFTTMITRAKPSIVFNGSRIYNYEMIRKFCTNLTCEEDKFYSNKIEDFCSFEKVTKEPKTWDIYCGCWKKVR